MYLKEIEKEFSDDLILKQSFQDIIPVENGLVILLPFSIISKQYIYICDYPHFSQRLAHNAIPDDCVFFIVNCDNSCRSLQLPPTSTCLFFRVSMENFYMRFNQIAINNEKNLKDDQLIKMCAAWNLLLKGQDIDFTKSFYPFKTYISCILIEPENLRTGLSAYSHLLEIFSDFFHDPNIFIYKEKLIVLYSQDIRPDSELDFSYSRLNELLEKYRLKAAISNACRYEKMYATLYRIASSALRLSKFLTPAVQKYTRIIQYSEFSMYYIIDLCVKEFIRIHNHKDIIYLISPSVIELYRYDKKHNSDLLDTLFHYLLCGRNVSDTANVLYMHRNTVLNKIHKISSIIHAPLDNGNIQFTLLMSCFIINYYENYLEEKL